ncbi:MAG TPA: HEAT repeat domain-containing protein [Planctomycetota bacterium]|nr:HEAT repeat domain-containing protein [Planctomycetota bacterium]
MRRTLSTLIPLAAAFALTFSAAGCRSQPSGPERAGPQPPPTGQANRPEPDRAPPYVAEEVVTRALTSPGRAATGQECRDWIAGLGGSKAAAGRLAEHLRRGGPSVDERRRIADILERCDRGDAVPGLALLAGDLEMGRLFRSGMLHLLSDAHGCREAVAPLANALKTDVVPDVRVRAASELAAMYLDGHVSDSGPIVEALIGALADKDEPVRDSAAWSLGCLAERDPGLIPRLEKLKEGSDAQVRAGAAEALRNVHAGKVRRPAEGQEK